MPRTSVVNSTVMCLLVLTAATVGLAQEQSQEQQQEQFEQSPGVAEASDFGAAPIQTVGSIAADDADGASLEERLSKLESAWSDMQAAEAQEKSSGNPTLRINGRIHLDHLSFIDDSPGIHFFENPATGIDPEDRFFFRRIRLRFEGDVTDNMLYRMQIDFNSPDTGEMKDMYIGFTDLPVFGTLLFGNQKRPLGFNHLNSSRYSIFIERALVVEAFNEDARRLGVAAYQVSDDQKYHWRYGAYALENMVQDGDISGDSLQ